MNDEGEDDGEDDGNDGALSLIELMVFSRLAEPKEPDEPIVILLSIIYIYICQEKDVLMVHIKIQKQANVSKIKQSNGVPHHQKQPLHEKNVHLIVLRAHRVLDVLNLHLRSNSKKDVLRVLEKIK